jgi:CorA-like Mg2+ transporter protein
MKVDPFYALHELFEFAGASELQFLNLTEDKLGPETSCEVLANETPSLSNLLYTLEILQAQTRRLTENIEKIKCRGSSQWPHAADNTDLGKKAKEAADLLLRDYEFLLAKAQDLSRQCERSMSVIMYSANIVESKRAMEQANRVGKLTMLAYLYVPLSFTSSFFGMNFTQFSSGPYLSVWVWFAVSVPVMAFSILFYVWDIPALVSRSATWQRMKRHWRNMWR